MAARKANLDLVEVAPNERPPVCRIMDFGKFKYQQKKRQHKSHRIRPRSKRSACGRRRANTTSR